MFWRKQDRVDTFNPGKSTKKTVFFGIFAFAIAATAVTLLVRGAQPLVIDTSVPQPTNVRVFADDQVLYLRWDDPSRSNGPHYGFYITYKKRGAATVENIRQTIHNTIQLQPLQNGQEYEITVQTARGSYQGTGLGYGGDNTNAGTQYWFRADGHVSPAVSINGTPSSLRVDAMRQRLTGFFDDFNEPANPINELKWNSATTIRSDSNTNGTFINSQFHAHTQLRSGFGGLINRPRATFNSSVGMNGGPLSESNPARVEWDMDITMDNRSNWYLDLIPLTVRRNRAIIDVHGRDQNDTTRSDEPGNMLRLNVTPEIAEFEYSETDLDFIKLNVQSGNDACGNFEATKVHLNNCNMSQKTSGLSPLPELADSIWEGDQNVRRHWIMEITPTRARVFVDSVLIMETVLPAAFASQREFTVHNSMFTYNTGKEWQPETGDPNRKQGVFPITHFYHWDNFGFTGPAPTTKIHNYIESSPDGRTPYYFRGEFDAETGQRTANIPIPDPTGSPINGRAKLYFTINNYYRWASGDHILVNGNRYNVPNPIDNILYVPPGYTDNINSGCCAHSVMVEINSAHLITGNNAIVNNMNNGQYGAASFTEPHIELEYPIGASQPYTQPIVIYGQAFSNAVEPRITNCDSYIYVEQDIDLPYLAGRPNLQIGPCFFLQTVPAHNPGYYNPGGQIPTVPARSRDMLWEAEFGLLVGEVRIEPHDSASNNEYIRF